MVNFKFVKAELKSYWITILVFGLLFTLLAILPLLITDNMIPSTEIITGENYKSTMEVFGGAQILNFSIYNSAGYSIFFAFGVTMITKTLLREREKGYLSSWLTAPMTRWTIFNTKLFSVILSTIIVFGWFIILQLSIYPMSTNNFSSFVGPLMLANLSLYVVSILLISIIWIFSTFIDRVGLSVAIIVTIFVWFVIAKTLADFGAVVGDDSNLKYLKYLKYLTILSMYNSPLNFTKQYNDINLHSSDIAIVVQTKEIVYYSINPIRTLDFAWQLPVMFGASTGILIGSQFILKNRNYSL